MFLPISLSWPFKGYCEYTYKNFIDKIITLNLSEQPLLTIESGKTFTDDDATDDYIND